ncbi:MAG: FRG domain-containing protein [Flavobacteriales bacterium]|nr:FRG domain-containing protein [Flavobacteriales bacterium]
MTRTIMKGHTVKSLLEYIGCITSFEQRHVAQWVYRGHCDSLFELTPSLFRLDISDTYANWHEAEAYMMERFKREAIPHLSAKPETELDWLTLAQHHGLPTRLLDWASNPLIALYFAVCGNPTSNADVWCFGLASGNNCWPSSTRAARKLHIESVSCLVFPRHVAPRVTNQSGCFTQHDLPDGRTPFVPFNKQRGLTGFFVRIRIPAKHKQDILNELYELGIHRAFIFPDLVGVSEHIKFDMVAQHKRGTNPDQVASIMRSFR